MAVHELDPISRIEGHLGAKLTVNAGKVDAVDVHGNLFRGFENFLIGREPNDAITFTQRICGVCPIPHGQAATWAVESAIGYSGAHQFQTGMGEIPTKAIHIRNVVLGAEFLMSSLTHFYHLAAPSYVQGPAVPPWTPYFADAYYSPLLLSSAGGTNGGAAIPNYATSSVLPLDSKGFSADLWSAVIKQYVKALRIRRLTFEAGAMFAGRMPMTSCYVAGGVTTYKADSAMSTKCTKFTSLMTEIGDFVVREYVPIVLALGALYPNFDNEHNGGQGWGAGCGNFLAWGGFPNAGVAMDANGVTGNHFPRGWVKNAGGYFGAAQTTGTIAAAAVQTELVEHTHHSRYKQDPVYGYNATDGTSYPYTASRTVPERAKATAYSYLKAPRWSGDPMEVGPLARLVVAGLYPINMAAPVSLVDAGGNLLQQVAALYTKSYDFGAGAETGLDPKMIGPDLAVACVRADAAALKVSVDMSAISAAADPGVFVWKVTTGSAIDNAPAGTAAAPKTIGIDHADISSAEIVVAYQLASAIIVDGGTIPLVTWIATMQLGLSTMDRLRARALESAVMMIWMLGMPSKPALAAQSIAWANNGWVNALSLATGETYTYMATPADGTSHTGIGGTEAPRGALMHICTIGGDGKIERYQCIVPTTWNACPKDFAGTPGPMEQAIAASATGAGYPALSKVDYAADGGKLYKPVTGGAVVTTQGGVEALRIAQSFDPCIACAVH